MRTITWKPRERKALDGDGEIAILEGFASFFFFLFFSPLLCCARAGLRSGRALELDQIWGHGTRTAGSWKKPLASLKEKYITAIYSWVAVACKKKKKKKKRERERATTPWVILQDVPSQKKKKKKKTRLKLCKFSKKRFASWIIHAEWVDGSEWRKRVASVAKAWCAWTCGDTERLCCPPLPSFFFFF